MFGNWWGSHIPVLQSPTVLLQPMVQESPCLPNVRTGTLSTSDAVDHTLPAVDWNGILGVNQLLLQGSKRMEGDLDGLQAQHPAEGLRQATEVGKGQ